VAGEPEHARAPVEAVGGAAPAASYTPGTIGSGRTLWVSGQGPLVDGVYVPGTIEEETTLTLERIAAVLAAAGTTPAAVTRCGVYLADLDDFAGMDAAFARFFRRAGGILPARTTVGTQLLHGMKVEIDCTAIVA